MTYKDYRTLEITQAVIKFHDEMESIHVKRLDICAQEIEAWKELQQVLLADAPQRISEHFHEKKHLS